MITKKWVIKSWKIYGIWLRERERAFPHKSATQKADDESLTEAKTNPDLGGTLRMV